VYQIGAFGLPSADPLLFAPNITTSTADPIWGLGAKYSGMFAGGSFGVGIGYQFTDDSNEFSRRKPGRAVTGLSANVALDYGLSAAVNYMSIQVDGANNDGVHMGIGMSYAFDAVTLHANYGHYDWDAGADAEDAAGYGLSAAYDFGGGLSAHFGYGWGEVTALNSANFSPNPALGSTSTWSLGLNMSF
jgi:outer membrane protein OmpU